MCIYFINSSLLCFFPGRTPILPKLPHIPGDEGVGDVVEVGSLVSKINIGNKVVLRNRQLGTWRYYGIYNECDLHVVPSLINLPDAALLSIAPCSAYRMLKDYVKLEPGQTVVQNGANSAVGQSVIQLCRVWGIKTFNIVASHCGYEAVKDHLLSLGATCVLTLEEAEELTCFNTSLIRPSLALNCLGGRHENVLLKLLKPCGSMVYYGGAYDLPLTKKYIRGDVFFSKFNLTDWMTNVSGVVDRQVMYQYITQLMVIGKHCPPVFEHVELKNYVHALRNTVHCEAFSNTYYIFDFTVL